MEVDANNYLTVLSERALADNRLTQEEYSAFQGNLWQLLGERTERYTMGDSSSVPMETAQELLESICFCIGLALKASGSSDTLAELKATDLSKLFTLGMAEAEAQTKIGKERLEQVKASMLPIDNYSYGNLISELESFFSQYDFYYFAHDIPCFITYLLFREVTDLQGIEYINEYIKRLMIENDFCGHFDTQTVTSLLHTCSIDFNNIFEPVAFNAIGLSLLDGNITTLTITEADRTRLVEYFSSWTDEKAAKKLHSAVETLCRHLGIQGDADMEYLQDVATVLHGRVNSAATLNNLFVSIDDNMRRTPATQFIDGKPLDDDRLRDLIEEINDAQILEDKVAVVTQNIHSLRDLMEVLSVCFWEQESVALFTTLDDTALAILLHGLSENRRNNPDWRSATNWESELAQYVETLSNSRKSRLNHTLGEL